VHPATLRLAALAAACALLLAGKAPMDRIPDPAGAGIVGTLTYWESFPSAHLPRPRTVSIWLPPGYDKDPDRRFPVVYAHDGQNLFDPRLSFTKVDWGLDEAVAAGIADGTIDPPIIVGVWNTPDRRREYCPWDMGPQYARFLTEELMPEVNRRFRTRVGAASTASMGASMGGLISFWLCWKHPGHFGLGGCLSTHFPFDATDLARAQGRQPDPSLAGKPLIVEEIAAGTRFEPHPKPRIWMDHGTLNLDATYGPAQSQVDAWLVRGGMERDKDFVSRTFEGADHNEAAWRARAPEVLRFLFPGKGDGKRKPAPGKRDLRTVK
jgi:hypothetical protein